MFGDDLPKKQSNEFPRNLESLSIQDLKEYISELENEIERVEKDIKVKTASQAAADSVFKS